MSGVRRSTAIGVAVLPTALAALLGALVLSWPMLFVTAPVGYFDTLGYLAQGETAAMAIFDLDGAPPDAGAAEQAGSREDGLGDEGIRAARSPVYSLFAFLTAQTPLGLALTTMLQTAAVLFLVLAVFGQRAIAARVGIPMVVMIGFFTPLPWMASYAMPDLLAAAIIAFAMLLVSRWDSMTLMMRSLAVLIAAFATISHYGHLPFAAGLLAGTLLLLLVSKRLRLGAALAAITPVAVAVGVSLAGSTVAMDGPSLAPKRLPILLARSIQDGPALWHLQAACPEADYALCRHFPEMPDTVTEFLWDENGIASLTASELDEVRREEFRILWNAFLDYPIAQTTSLAGNALLQIVKVGTGEILPLLEGDGRSGYVIGDRDAYPILRGFNVLSALGVLVGVVIVVAAGLRRPIESGVSRAGLVLLGGLILNAVIFGGLSYPVDRYQSRIAWLIPVYALLLLSHRRKEPGGAASWCPRRASSSD